MNYRESKPSPLFAGLVRCFWALEYAHCGANEPEPVVPDGCIEIIFNLSDRFRRFHRNGEVETQPSSLIAGQMLRGITIGPSGNVRLFGIRFEPAGAYPFFRFDVKDLMDRIEPLESVWGNGVSEIEDQLCSALDFASRVGVAESALTEAFSRRRPADPWLGRSIDMLGSGGGVREISKELGVSERTLERRFQRFVGLTPKIYSRIIRFQRVLRAMQLNSKPNILDAALLNGYYDQSHLINDCRQFAGTTPSALLNKSQRMTELFITAE